MRRLWWSGLLAVACAAGHAGDGDWLTEDEGYALDDTLFEAPEAAPRYSRVSLSHFLTQSDQLVRSRSLARFEYERPVSEGHYVRVDGKVRRFHPSDELADVKGGAYQEAEIEALWWQVSARQCFVKAGRQGVYWGGVDNSFALDQLTPFDYTEALLTSFTGLRQAEDLLQVQCYEGAHQVQLIINPRPGLSVLNHDRDRARDALEAGLHEEWGVRWQWSTEGREVAFMWARLEDNLPTPVGAGGIQPYRLEVARFDVWGMSLSQSVGALLVLLDAAYHRDQLQAFTNHRRHEWEVALGMEYTSTANHRYNAGVWRFRAPALSPAGSSRATALFNLGWSKSVWRDDLELSVLGLWGGEPRIGSLTGLADYQWSDHWSTQVSLSYANAAEGSDIALAGFADGWSTSASIDWVY